MFGFSHIIVLSKDEAQTGFLWYIYTQKLTLEKATWYNYSHAGLVSKLLIQIAKAWKAERGYR